MNIDHKQLFHLAILEAAEKFGDSVALTEVESNESLTFAGFRKKCFQFAAILSSHVDPISGGKSHKEIETVLVFLQNCINYPIVFCGSALLGHPICGINPDSTKDELKSFAKKTNAKFIVCSSENLEFVKSAFSSGDVKIFVFGKTHNPNEKITYLDSEFLTISFDEDLASTLSARSRALSTSEDTLIAPLSSGSTGEPKCVLLSHKNFNSATEILKKNLFEKLSKSCERTVNLSFLPFYHASGFWALCYCLLNGHQSIIMKTFKVTLMMECIEKFKIEILNLVPSLVIFLTKNYEEFKIFNLTSLKVVLCGSAPIGKEVITEFLSKYPHVEEFIQGYGMTEVVCLSHIIPLEGSAKDEKHFGSCGKLLEGFEAMLVDPDTHEIRSQPMESGELWLKSDAVMKGYLKNDEANSKSLESSGWLKTGDVLYFDEDGYYYVVDRLKNMIKVNGMQVAPVELENLFLKLDFVSEAAVVGIQDADSGEVPVAFLVLKKEEIKNKMTIQEAIETAKEFVHSKVAPHKQLRGGIIIVEKLPKTSTGKVIRKELQSLAMAEHETVL